MADDSEVPTVAPTRGVFSGGGLRQARRTAGLTQAELARRLDVRLWLIDQWETGGRPIPEDRQEALWAAIGWPSPDDGSDEAAPALETETFHDDSQLHAAPAAPTMELMDDLWRPIDPDLPRALRGYEPDAVHALLGELSSSLGEAQGRPQGRASS